MTTLLAVLMGKLSDTDLPDLKQAASFRIPGPARNPIVAGQNAPTAAPLAIFGKLDYDHAAN